MLSYIQTDGWWAWWHIQQLKMHTHTCQRLAQRETRPFTFELLIVFSFLVTQHSSPFFLSRKKHFFTGSRPRLCQWKFLSDCGVVDFKRRISSFPSPPIIHQKRGECLIIIYTFDILFLCWPISTGKRAQQREAIRNHSFGVIWSRHLLSSRPVIHVFVYELAVNLLASQQLSLSLSEWRE